MDQFYELIISYNQPPDQRIMNIWFYSPGGLSPYWSGPACLFFNLHVVFARTISAPSLCVRSKWEKCRWFLWPNQVGLPLPNAAATALSAQEYFHSSPDKHMWMELLLLPSHSGQVARDWTTSEARHSLLYCKVMLVSSWLSRIEEGTLCNRSSSLSL